MLKKLLPTLFILSVVLILFLTNFSPSTWFSGWDNLHPEFSFGLNIKRSIFAVWQEYQGLGLLGGMGHASDLPRQILLFFLSLFFSDQWLRPLYFFLMLLLGALGVYFLLDKIILSNLAPEKRKVASFSGGLFYLLNLATIQTFYTAFEPFTTHFGFLPWLFLATFLFVRNPSFKNVLFFLVINIFAVPQAYVPTTFLVYFFALISSLIILLFQQKGQNFSRVVKIIILTLIINAFWLLPFIYFTLTTSQVTVEAKINQMTTESTFLRNKKFGDITDVMLLRGFWFEFNDFNQTTKDFDFLMVPWRKHLENPLVRGVGLFFFAVILVGIFAAFRQKNRYRLIFLFLFFFSFTILANNTPPFAWIDSLLYKLPLLSQALRSPFTKFSFLASFSYSIFFAFGISWLVSFLKKRLFLTILTTGLLVFFTFPAFQGNLFYKQTRVEIPEDYFALFKFFRQQDVNTRIANFPQQTFWGWNFYRWGYGGSGFLWYGVEQPILDRAFDVWNNKDENYYWEISNALYSNNQELFEKVLEKYQINWFLVDEDVINPPSPKALYLDKLEQILSSSQKVSLARQFGKIKIYEVSLTAPVRNFVYLGQNIPVVSPEYKWNNFDQAFLDNSHYISYPTSNFSLLTSNAYYPFRSLFSGKNQEDLEFSAKGGSASGGTVEDKGDYFLFKKALPSGFENYSLEVPEINPQDFTFVDPADLSRVQKVVGDIYFDGQVVAVKVPKIGGYYSAEITPLTTEIKESSRDCDKVSRGFFRWTLAETTDCLSFSLANLSHNLSYLVTVESKNDSGKSLLFWLENLNSRRADIETYLPKSKFTTSYFIQPPMEEDGVGYTLHFDNISIGDEKAVNDLGKVTVNPIPFKFLTGLVLVSPEKVLLPQKKSASDPRGRASKLVELNVMHPNPSFYQIAMEQLSNVAIDNQVLVLSQSYEKGWKAYQIKLKTQNSKLKTFFAMAFPFVFGEEIKEHVLVNNWSNGWVLGNATMQQLNNATIVIIYLPQYLEFAGFGLLIIVLTSFVILTKNKTSI